MQSPLSIPMILQELASFASVVQDLLAPPNTPWYWKPDSDSWSLTEVVCHLRDVEEEVHMMRYKEILSRDNPFLSGVSSDEWAAVRDYQSENGSEARDAFFAARQKSLQFLADLDETSWNRRGRHAFFGPTSIKELANLAAQHDQVHLQQINDLLAGGK